MNYKLRLNYRDKCITKTKLQRQMNYKDSTAETNELQTKTELQRQIKELQRLNYRDK